MKVTDAQEIRAIGAGTRSAQERAPEQDRAVGEHVSTDDSARLAQAIAAASEAAGPRRAARLASIETAVRQGTYRPDPQRIAEEILDDAELAARLQTLLGG